MIGSELVPYPLEMQAFVNYLKANKPNATIALLKANDDFGQSYAETLKQLVKGTTSRSCRAGLRQRRELRGEDAGQRPRRDEGRHVRARRDAARVPERAERGGRPPGWKPITYMSGTCVSKLLLDARRRERRRRADGTPLLDPADPANARTRR